MEEDSDNPSNTDSLDVIEMLHGSALDVTKKRKLHSNLFSLPVRKHMCLSRGATPSSTLEGYPESGHLQPNMMTKAKDGDTSFQPEPAEGSNSLMEESTSIISLSTELETTPSTSDVIWGSNSSANQTYSSDGNEVQEMEIRDEEDISSPYSDGLINLRQILEEQLLEFGAHTDYNGSDLMEHSGDNGTGNVIDSNGMNSKSYVLSSGRWNIERDGQPTTGKPTIDKEFEQHFSMLML